MRFVLIVVHLIILAPAAFANPPELANTSVFVTYVSGKPADRDLRDIDRLGVAFSIGNGVLLTAGHVPGDLQNFQDRNNQTRSAGGQLTNVPSFVRDIALAYRLTDANNDMVVRQLDQERGGFKTRNSPFGLDVVDVARIDVTKSNINLAAFKLNACGLNLDDNYYVHTFDFEDNDPATRDALRPQVFRVNLSPHSDFVDLNLSTLVVHSDSRTKNGRQLQQGDSGAPVVNKAGEVVGLLSATIKSPERNVILLTPVVSFLDLLPPDASVACTTRVQRDEFNTLLARMEALEGYIFGEVNGTPMPFEETFIAEIQTRIENAVAPVNGKSEVAVRSVHSKSLFEGETIPDDVVMQLKERMDADDFVPVGEDIQALKASLANLTWDFNLSVVLNEQKKPQLKIDYAYRRALLGRPFREYLEICAFPLIGPASGKQLYIKGLLDRDNLDNAKACADVEHSRAENRGRVNRGNFTRLVDHRELNKIIARLEEGQNWFGEFFVVIIDPQVKSKHPRDYIMESLLVDVFEGQTNARTENLTYAIKRCGKIKKLRDAPLVAVSHLALEQPELDDGFMLNESDIENLLENCV